MCSTSGAHIADPGRVPLQAIVFFCNQAIVIALTRSDQVPKNSTTILQNFCRACSNIGMGWDPSAYFFLGTLPSSPGIRVDRNNFQA
jgi:hypothetical protein